MCVRERGRVRKSVFPRFLVTYLKTTDNIECKSPKIINENSEKSTWFSACVCVCVLTFVFFLCKRERERERLFFCWYTASASASVSVCVCASQFYDEMCIKCLCLCFSPHPPTHTLTPIQSFRRRTNFEWKPIGRNKNNKRHHKVAKQQQTKKHK